MMPLRDMNKFHSIATRQQLWSKNMDLPVF